MSAHGTELQAMIRAGLRSLRSDGLRAPRLHVAWGCQLIGYRNFPVEMKRTVRRLSEPRK